MARKNRNFNTFSLAFLDIMSCGLGAVALIFLILKHESDNYVDNVNKNLISEVTLLEEEVLTGRKNLAQLRNTIEEFDQEIVQAHGAARRIQDEIATTNAQLVEVQEQSSELDIPTLEKRKKRLEEEQKKLLDKLSGAKARTFAGDGQRQYLTGLMLGGERILILVDRSASMLDDTIVNVIRRRNMSDSVKSESPKWVRTVKTVEWLIAQLPLSSRYQIYSFNTQAKPVLEGTEKLWLNVDDRDKLDAVAKALRETVPDDGTSLINAFETLAALDPAPDNIILITDGLPTQGRKTPSEATVSRRKRLDLFNDAVDALPVRTPINIILMPFEGDPDAASSFWRVAVNTQGSFIAPSKDWP